MTANLRFDGRSVRMTVKGERVDTGLRKLGAVIGGYAQTGINVSLMPGVKVGARALVYPGVCCEQGMWVVGRFSSASPTWFPPDCLWYTRLYRLNRYIAAYPNLPKRAYGSRRVVSKLCGIIGLAFAEGSGVASALVRGLKRLEYRGYDSMGVAVIEGPGRLVVRKAAGKIEEVARRTGVLGLRGRVGIGHTRWATHGPPNDVNAHPHTDCGGRVAVVHNGVIRNYASLRRELESRGHRLVSETDTELVAHLVEDYLSRGYSFLEALAFLGRVLRGSYALALLHSGEPERVYFVRYKSPLVVGLGDGVNAVASDITAVLDVARDVVVLEDGEFGWIAPGEVAIYRPRGDGGFEPLPPGELRRRVKRVEWTPESASKAGYPHYMLKEIYEQPQALSETLEGIIEDPRLERAAELVAGSKGLFIVGAGTSYHAGLAGQYYLSRLAGVVGHVVVASEHKVYTPGVGEDSVVVAVSQSGETFDTLEAVREWRRRGARIVGVTNVVGSALDRESDVTLYLRAGPEIGVAATKTFLAQTILLQTLAVAAARMTGRLSGGEARGLLAVLEGASETVTGRLGT
ncbi:glutamine--fructose-6-phosphate transaminase (isomerizing) [Aeropyrum camini]|uniref:glutamine--fructose-6-phosphate transaminase (isomerizing) n=1 Tax=Aeropyrum camini TaxID=229980 RepID=UPI00210D85F3|nr:glutamine--fructose-6-phosphate transaminase (isomerizing) [Aeropyrum camini]